MDPDLLGDITRLPEAQRLTIILNELGAGFAGRGSDLNATLRRSNPALQGLEQVLAILAKENKTLTDLAVEGDRATAPLAAERARLVGFIKEGGKVAQATARHRGALAQNLADFPAFLEQLGPAMERLGRFAQQTTPTFEDLGIAAPGINKTYENLGPFSKSLEGFLGSFGKNARRTSSALRAVEPLLPLAKALGKNAKPFATNFSGLFTSLRSTGGLERLLDFIYLGAGSVNGYDALGHFLRAEIVGSTLPQLLDRNEPHLRDREIHRCEQLERQVLDGARVFDELRDAAHACRAQRYDASRGDRQVPGHARGRDRRRQWRWRPGGPIRCAASGSASRRGGGRHHLLLALRRKLRGERHAPQLPARQLTAMIRRPFTTTSLLLLWALPPLAVLAILIPASAALAETTATVPAAESSASAPATTTVPAPSQPAPPQPSSPANATPTATTTTETPPSEAPGSETTTVPAPEVRARHPQPRTAVSHRRGSAPSTPAPAQPGGANSKANAVAPSALTPPLPSTLGGALVGVPSFFIDSFSIPPFLLPIYQAAGAAYGIPWQVLAAINEVESDYGRDLSVSSAGAEGWMQFLPSTWGQYGVDVNNDGFEDPYNPADAIFGAARYLKDAGGDIDIRAAIFAYNHSQAYVNSVLLRARLLGGTPPALLGAITGLTEARFPVYAASHYSDGFPVTEEASPRTIAGTTIYSQDGAPAIAVQDGRIVQIDAGGPFGRTISLRDAYGNTYTYAGLGTLATLYPVLEAPESAAVRGAGSSGATFEASAASQGATRQFRAGSENVYLHPLRVGARVIAGTVLGHVGAGVAPHLIFQIHPAGAPLIDPKPILDGWVKLQSSSAVKAKGRDPFAKISPSAGQALLESKTQLEQQVPRDHGIRLARCERRLIDDGRADRRVLAALEFLSASGLKPTVSARSCTPAAATAAHGAPLRPAQPGGMSGDAVDISAINGIPVVGPAGPGTIATVAVRKLAKLQGVMKPLQIASAARIAGAARSVALPGYAGVIHVAYTPLSGGKAHAASATSTSLTPAQWLKLVARLGEVPDPTVSPKPSSAAIPDQPSAGSSLAKEGR